MTKKAAGLALASVIACSVAACGSQGSDPAIPPPAEPVSPALAAVAGTAQRDIVLGDLDAPDVLVVYSDPDGLRTARFDTDVLPALVRGPVSRGRLQLHLAPVRPADAPVDIDVRRDPARDVLAAARQNRAWSFALRYAGAGTGAYDDAIARSAAAATDGLDVARWERDAASSSITRRSGTYRQRYLARGGALPQLRLDRGRDGRDVRVIELAEVTPDALADGIAEALGYR